MTITRTYQGQNEDGTPRFLYETDGHALITGPAYGPVTTSDGTTYDVSEPVIEVASVEHAGEVSHQIAVWYERNGHPNVESFVHECTDACGALKRV